MSLPILSIILYQIFPRKGKLINFSSKIDNTLLDSGATHNFISLKSCEGLQISETRPLRVGNAVQSFENPVTKVVEANVKIQNNMFHNRKFYVLETLNGFEAIVGMEILKNTALDFSGSFPFFTSVYSNQISIKEPELNFIPKSLSKEGIFTCDDIILAPYETKWINICVKPKNQIENCTIITPSDDLISNHIAVNPWGTKNNQIGLFNNSKITVSVIDKGACIGKICENEFVDHFKSEDFDMVCNYLISREELSPEDRLVHDRELEEWRNRRQDLLKQFSLEDERKAKVKEVPEQFRTALNKLLLKFNKIFSRGVNDVGLAPNFVVDLIFNPGDAGRPSYSRPYKLKAEYKERLDQKIEEMLKSRIVVVCNSPWSTPTMVVKKKSGDLRIVHNFSKDLNSRLIVSHFPIVGNRQVFADISKGIHELEKEYPDQKVWFFSFDLSNAYFTLSVRNSKRDILAFILNDRMLRYSRLAQGLSLSPSTFQMYMKKMLWGENFKKKFLKIYNFLDDYLVILPENHALEGISLFFEQCLREQFILNMKKCSFFQEKIRFLGYEISQKGIEAEESRIKGILDLPDPKTTKEAQRILGTLNFVSRSFPRISHYLKPLSQMVGKKKIYLSKEIQIGLAKIKDFLRSHPKLLPHLKYDLDANEKIFVCCDSALTGAGYCMGNLNLINDEISNIRITHYGSSAFDAQTQLLSSRARELIGAAAALESFSDLLPESLAFLLLVDHKSLIFIKNSEALGKTLETHKARLAFSKLLNYPRMTIAYISNNHELLQVADGLGRNSSFKVSLIPEKWLNTVSLKSNLISIYQEKISLEKIRSEQSKDPKLVEIKSKMNRNKEYTDSLGEYIIKNDLIFVRVRNGRELMVIPASLGEDIVSMVHISSLHPGIKLMNKILNDSNFFIRNRFSLVRRITRFCLLCQLRSPRQFPKEDKIFYPIKPALRPWAACCTDLVDLSYSGHCYAILLLDKFSRFVDHELINRKSADHVIPAIMILITRNNCAHYSILQSDNGKEYINSAFKLALDRLGIKHSRSSAYNSSTNPCERVIKELRSLMDNLEPNQTDFRTKFKLACNFYNARPQERLNNLSPSEVLHGADRPLVLGHLVDPPVFVDSEEISEYSIAKWFEYLQQLQIKHAQSEYERYTLRNHENYTFEIGQFVSLTNPVINLSKLSGRFAEGPFLIRSRKRDTYEITHIFTRQTLTRNARFLRNLCIEEKVKQELFQFFQKNINGDLPLPPLVSTSGYKIDVEGLKDSEPKNTRYNLRQRS